MKALVTAALSGVIFAVGLGLAGMTDPAKVVGFLDVAGDWDPTLAFVMGSALSVYAVLRRLIQRRQKPVLAPAFPDCSEQRIDRRLLVGSAIFGVGWGIAGYCPGPAIVSVTSGTVALVFVAAMVAGMWAHRVWASAVGARRSAADPATR